MPQEKPKQTVSGVVPEETVDDIEAYQYKRGISKSQAVRELVEDGVRYQRFFVRLIEQVVAIAFAGAIAATIAVALLWASALAGVSVGARPAEIAGILGNVATVLYLTVGVAWVLRWAGVGAWADGLAVKIESRIFDNS